MPKAGAFTTDTVGWVIGSFDGAGSVVSNLIIDLVDMVNPLEALTIIFLDTSTWPWKIKSIVSPASPSLSSAVPGEHFSSTTTSAILEQNSSGTLLK